VFAFQKFVHLSVTHLNGKVCEHHFAIKPFEVINDLGIVEYEKFCSCACLQLFSVSLDGITTKC